MNREEAIKTLRKIQREVIRGTYVDKVYDMAIEALEGVCFDEWCDDCKEYDTEKKCCPRFNKVIREALKREPSEDGTLEIKVEDATKVGRVLISDDKHRGGLYYPDEDEPQKSYPTEWCEQCTLWEDNKCIGVAQCKSNIDALKQVMSDDLISRAEAIEAVHDACNYCDTCDLKDVGCSQIRSLKELTSADRPKDGDLISRAEAIEALGEEPLVWCDDDYEIAERSQWRADIEAIKSVPSADRPSGEWIGEDGTYYANCSKCGYQMDTHVERGYFRYCPNCGADMRARSEK